nr:hypothetical protein [Actinomycetota bacterium]
MRGTRRTMVTAAASFAVVLGVGSVAAATSGHGSRPDSTTGTSVAAAHREPGRASARAHLQEASSPTETDEDTSTAVDESTTSTVDEQTSTIVRNHTPDTAENDLGDDEGDDQGEATEEAHENENAELHDQDERTST